MWVLHAAGGKVKDLDINLWPAIIPQYKREPILEVKGAGKVLPSSVEVQVVAFWEHLHLSPGQALLVV